MNKELSGAPIKTLIEAKRSQSRSGQVQLAMAHAGQGEDVAE